ncbi:MAG: glycerate kinase [Cyclobacteriaceae bacterium]
MNILIAPNAFKNSLDAVKAAEAICRGLEESPLACKCLLQPIADGGDGMLTVMLSQQGGEVRETKVDDPLGRKVKAKFGLISNGKTAVIEMAEASGIRLMSQDELNPMKASSFGTGQLMKAALDAGAEELVIGLGGSATVDLGLGMAQALGVKLLDEHGKDVGRGGESLQKIRQIDMSQVDERLQNIRIIVTCDVTNTLLEAPSVFGPQKGADEEMVSHLEKQFSRLDGLVESQLGKSLKEMRHGGAAGGLGVALAGFFDAQLVEGTAYLLARTGFKDELKKADLLITAEGALDRQTLSGKGPHYVAEEARKNNLPVIMLAGSIPDDFKAKDYSMYDVVLPIGPRPQPLEQAMQYTADNLQRTARQIGAMLHIRQKK